MTGSKQEALSYPDCPLEFNDALTHFYKISDITDIGIKAYKDLMELEITPTEVELIKDIDYVKRAVTSGKKPDQVMELFAWHS
ncbi:MAG: phage tail assembly chaperone [Vibrio gallaecicus]